MTTGQRGAGAPTLDPQREADRLAGYRAGLNDRQIASAEGRDSSTIRLWRLARGLPANRRGFAPLTVEQRARRMLYYQLGWSDGRIAREEGVTEPSVFVWRRRMGLPANGSPGGVPQVIGIGLEAVMARIRRAVGRGLPADIADDAVANLMLAIMDGTLSINAIEASARKFGNRVLDQFASKYGPRSLDKELGDDEGFTLLDTLVDERSSSWLEEMGATVW